MKIRVLLYMLSLFALAMRLAYADERIYLQLIPGKEIPVFLNIAVPAEYAEFNRIKAEGNDLATCKSVVALLDRVYQQQQERPVKVGINKPGGGVELMAWKLAVKTYKSSTEPGARELIKQAWHKCIQMDRDNRKPQLDALFEDWEESLMTEESIEVFKTTLDPMTIAGFAKVFGRYGDDKELALLQDKLVPVEANLKGREPAYSVAKNNIRMAIESIMNWKTCGTRVPNVYMGKPPTY